MATIMFEAPMMYGDHHVIEVRGLLAALPGVGQIYASSSFHEIEVQFDELQVSGDAIRAKLDAAGYLGELTLPAETGAAQKQDGRKPFFRHTAVTPQTGQVVSFAQKAPYEGRPLWPCPSVGVIQKD